MTYFVRCTPDNIDWGGLDQHKLKLGDWLILLGENTNITSSLYWPFNGKIFISTKEIKISKVQ